MNVEGSKVVWGGDNMVISPINSHNDGKKGKANKISQGISQGTEELLRNILGPDFEAYEINDGDSLQFPNRNREITRGKVATAAQQSRHINHDPAIKLSGPVKEFFIRYIFGAHEKVIESNL